MAHLSEEGTSLVWGCNFVWPSFVLEKLCPSVKHKCIEMCVQTSELAGEHGGGVPTAPPVAAENLTWVRQCGWPMRALCVLTYLTCKTALSCKHQCFTVRGLRLRKVKSVKNYLSNILQEVNDGAASSIPFVFVSTRHCIEHRDSNNKMNAKSTTLVEVTSLVREDGQ